MTEPDYDTQPAGVSARDLAPEHEDSIDRISLIRRQSRNIPSPRKWRTKGIGERVCPECRVPVPSIQDGFWHLQKVHNQGKGIDLEAWAIDLRDEVDEFIEAAAGKRGFVDEYEGASVVHMTSVLLGIMVVLVAGGVLYVLKNLGVI
jgi:hypothetical protein